MLLLPQTVARDSVRDCPANDELRDHLADLVAESMHTIRDQGLLNVEFLATLPNTRDSLSPFYLPIQERLIEEFKQEKLVPMKQGRHAPVSECYRGLRELSDLIKDKDLATLLGKDCSKPLWIANPQQINQPADNFLSMLGVSRWTTEDLIKVLENQADTVTELLRGKPDDWHQNLYVLLGDFLSSAPSSPLYIARERQGKLFNLGVVRCSDDEYRLGSECHFPNDDVELNLQEGAQQEGFHYVAQGVYSSGQNKNQQKKARAFLEGIGVCEVDEAERIKAILRQRYEDPDTVIPSKLHEEDIKRFIFLVESNPDKVSLFEGYNIFNTFEIFNTSGGYWPTSLIFLDSPYLETGLTVYYEDDEYWEFISEENVDPYFSLDYEQSDIDLKRLGKFTEKLGAKTKLEVKPQSTLWHHPESDDFAGEGGNWTRTGIDKDYRIPEFQILLARPSIAKSTLIWQTMLSLPIIYLKAQFRWNQKQELREKGSSVVYDLKDAKWVPQKNGDSISFVHPCDALRDHLPGGFPYDAGQKWLEAIEFGKTAEQRRSENNLKRYEQSVRNQRATEMGFNSANEANTMAEIANALKEQGKSPDELHDKLIAGKRRKERIRIEIEDAPEKEYEQRLRSVRSTIGTIDRRTHLRTQYTTDSNNMECQMCRQDMPFKKRGSDEDYFEAVEALGKDRFPKEHEAQHLALCPECAAKYKELVKRDKTTREILYNLLKSSDGPEVRLSLSDFVIRIWFKDKHWQDLKTVLDYYEDEYAHENLTD